MKKLTEHHLINHDAKWQCAVLKHNATEMTLRAFLPSCYYDKTAFAKEEARR
ncbi:hypothetical protein [Photobacterium profundum]|uniref:hypothetical protein n=1 Tax=Photobacterium profundum TaxID=74109 RepID=UPI003D0A4136